jgi:bifunctional DNA-binding transcriptional regulator/antitoxin component of YhaV-PrlF toxin-antitoxin module
MTKTFTAVIQAGRGGGAYAIVPFDVEKVFGSSKLQVKATIEGETFVTSLMKMGMPEHFIGIPKALRAKLGKDVGATIKITVEPDATPREVMVPADLEKAFKRDKVAKDVFHKLNFTHRKEYVRWITEAKKEETRARRVEKTLKMLKTKPRGL